MTITFKARVLVELGAELISSDAVALFELIKNGIDAGSRKVEIDVRVVLQPSSLRQLHFKYSKPQDAPWDQGRFVSDVEARLEPTAPSPQKDRFMAVIGNPSSAAEGLSRLDEAAFICNSICVVDQGKGMTASDLSTRYLTIGTPMRLHERKAVKPDRDRIPLGEKGIGRLGSSSPVVISTKLRRKHIEAIFFFASMKKFFFQSFANTFFIPVACASEIPVPPFEAIRQ